MKNVSKNKTSDLKPISLIYTAMFGLVGFLISLPPVSADAKIRSAQISRDAIQVADTMKPGFFNPLNTQYFLQNIQAFEGSGLFDLAHENALAGVKWNPEAYDLWRALFLVKNSTELERQLALENMKRLDPLNPEIAAR